MELKEELEKKLRKWNERDSKNYPIRDDVFHASEAGICPRVIFLNRTKKMDLNEKTIRVFKVGKIIHELIEKVIEDSEPEGYTEYKVGFKTDKIEIWGQVDYINRLKRFILEFKSTAMDMVMPKEEHIAQLNLYLGFTGINDGKIVYIKKQDLEITEFPITFNEELFNKTIKKFEYVSDKLKAKASWKEVRHEESISCNFDPYREYCKGV